MMRIVSLLPSATEIVYALGLDDRAGRRHLRVRRAGAGPHATSTVVVGGRDTTGMTPGEIDAYVRAQAAAGADLYHLHQDALAGLDPDLVLTQDLCWVCALPSGDGGRGAATILGCPADVVSLDPYSLDEVLATIATVAAAPGRPSAATQLLAGLRARLDAVGSRGRRSAAAAGGGRRVGRPAVHRRALDPRPGPRRRRRARWRATPGERSVPTTWDAIAAAAPDVVVVSPCGYHLDGAAEQAAVVARAVARRRRSGRSTATA